jgi:hypothetical protein
MGGIEILTDMFLINYKMGKNFYWTGKLIFYTQFIIGKGNHEKPGNYRGISHLSICDKIFSGILTGRLRDWLICHKAL